MDYEDKAKEIRESLSVLIGQRLVRSVNWCATRNFYFGQADIQIDDAPYTVSLDCPWRIQRGDVIFVGSEDYYERAEDNTDESWKSGMPTGHLQNQKLAELLGELKGGSIVSTGARLIVEFVEADRYGGFRMGLGEACVLEVFPASTGQMEWMFRSPRRGSLILINGVLSKMEREDINAPP